MFNHTIEIVMTNSEIRQEAHKNLKGNWLYPVLCTLLFTAVTSVAGSIPGAGLLAVCPLGFGFSLTFLLMVRQQVEDDDIVTAPFGCFHHYGRYLGGSLLVALFTFLWSLLLVLPGIIKGFSYALTPYILNDEADLPVREAIRRSQQMMRGNKWRLFCLYLSFIGWSLLCCLTFGIGFLWLTPYVRTSVAVFYEDIKARQN